MFCNSIRLLRRCRPTLSLTPFNRQSTYSTINLRSTDGSSSIGLEDTITNRSLHCKHQHNNTIHWLSTAASTPDNDDGGTSSSPLEVTVTNSTSSSSEESSADQQLDDQSPNLKKSPDQEKEEEILQLQSELRTHHRHAAYDTALQTASTLLDLTISHFGDQHPATASAYNNVGLMAKCLGKYSQAKEAYHKSLSIYGEVCGKDHASYAAALSNLGMLERGRVLESESAANNNEEEIDETNSSIPDEDDVDLKDLRDANKPNEEKLSALDRMQLNESAIEYFDEAYKIRLSELGPNHPHTISSQSQLGSAMAAAVIAERRGRISSIIESELRQLKHAKNVQDVKEMEKHVPEAIARAASKTTMGGKGSKLTRRRWEAAEQHLRGALTNAVENPRGENVSPLLYVPTGNTPSSADKESTKVQENSSSRRRGLTLPPKQEYKDLSKKEQKKLDKQKLREHRRANANALRGATTNESKGIESILGVAGKVTTLSAATAAQNLAVFLKHYSDWMRLSLMDENNTQQQQAEPSQQQIQSTKALNQTIQEAQHLYESALHVRKSILPSHHPEVVATKFSLAELLDSPKVSVLATLTSHDDAEAEVVDGKRANQLREEILSTKALNQTIQEAQHLYESALHVRKSILPSHHPEVVATKFSLAELLDSPKVSVLATLTSHDDAEAEVVDGKRANQLREEILSAYNVEEK